MKNVITLVSALSFAAAASAADPAVVTFGNEADGHDVPKGLWGIFFEDINWAADGGLSVEMLANGGFDWQQADHEKWNCTEDGWEPDYREGGMARLSFQYGEPVHPNTAKHLRIEAFGHGLAGVRNRGLDGMWIKKGEPYRLVFDWREISRTGIDFELGKWSRFETSFSGDEKGLSIDMPFGKVVVEGDKDRVTFSILVSGRRTFEFDNVSLKPTGKNLVRAGLRKDLVDMLAGLKPTFVRFPGGCIVEEGDFQHWYDWRRTVGPRERRECILNRWTNHQGYKPYWETFDVGFYEYFLLCEELGAEPLPICLAGLTCQFQKPALMCDVRDIDFFTQCIFDLIEFANGGVDTKWGRVRAEMGHPAPFNLKMVGVGNENWDAPFFDRCEPIAKALREKHPEIKIIGSSGPGPDDGHYRYAWGRITAETADFVDEHYYRDPNWFLLAATRYDGYDRKRPPVYAGEYACHHHVNKSKPNSLWSAICEAVAMTGFERNCDVVKMASYAPLFAREGHVQWTPDLIWFNGTESWATPNYYVQQLFSLNRPDRTLPVKVEGASDVYASAGVRGGKRIVKLVNTSEEVRDVKIDLRGAAKVTTLSGAKLDVNARGAEVVKPVVAESVLEGSVALPACSLVVVEMK